MLHGQKGNFKKNKNQTKQKTKQQQKKPHQISMGKGQGSVILWVVILCTWMQIWEWSVKHSVFEYFLNLKTSNILVSPSLLNHCIFNAAFKNFGIF